METGPPQGSDLCVLRQSRTGTQASGHGPVGRRRCRWMAEAEGRLGKRRDITRLSRCRQVEMPSGAFAMRRLDVHCGALGDQYEKADEPGSDASHARCR